MKVHFTGDCKAVEKGIEILKRRLDFLPVSGETADLSIEVAPGGAHALTYSLTGKAGKISYQQPCNFYRALALILAAYRRGEQVDRYEDSNFTMDGIMIDCSRNAVPTVAGAKEMLEVLACMGLDMMMLYTEDTYEIPGLPYFGYMRGRLSQKELREIDRYALDLGIELIPCIQTAAHLAHALKWPWAGPIYDCADALLVGEEKTYEFIEQAIKSCAETFTTKRIHIGYDEAVWVGRGKYLDQHAYVPNTVLLKQHLDRVKKILEKYGRVPMMWGDMYYHMYQNEGVREEDGMGIVYWSYYEHDKETYCRTIDAYKEFSDHVIFAGGSWTWGMPVSPYYQTWTSTVPALEACVEKGISEVIVTMWGDNGQEASWFNGLPGIQLYAEFRYCGKDTAKVTEALLAERLYDCTGADLAAFQDMARIDMLKEERLYMCAPADASKAVLYSNPMMGVYDIDLENIGNLFELTAHYNKYAEKLSAHAASGKAFSWLFTFPAELASLCASKWNLGLRLKKAYEEDDRTALSSMAEEMNAMKEQVSRVRLAHREVWMRYCKAFGWDILDIRYGGLICQLDTGAMRVKQYAEGKLEALEELAELRLPFNGETEPHGILGVAAYDRIASSCQF